jgi:hypothetical protein
VREFDEVRVGEKILYRVHRISKMLQSNFSRHDAWKLRRLERRLKLALNICERLPEKAEQAARIFLPQRS